MVVISWAFVLCIAEYAKGKTCCGIVAVRKRPKTVLAFSPSM